MNHDEIIDALGADNWAMVVAEYAGKSRADILDELDEMFPTEDNRALANAIVAEMPH